MNRIVGAAALGGTAVLFFYALGSPHPSPGAPAAAALFGAFLWIMWLWRDSVNIHHRKEAAAEVRQIAPEPAPELVPVPSPWAIEMFREYEWVDPLFGRRVHRELIRLARDIPSEVRAQEVVRELNAARKIVQGEVA
jgi:hypothetical protein